MCPTQHFQWKLICTFNQHCLSYKVSNRLQFNSILCFSENSSKLCCIDINFSKMCRTFKRCLSTYIYFLWAIIEGTLVIVYQIHAQLWYKTTCSESESRNFDCQWTLVTFLVKHNHFYREARLTCPLYRPSEDICIGICVFKHVFNLWYMLKKSVSMQQHFEQFVGKQRRVELKSVGNSVAKTMLVESANHFSLEELCRTQYGLKYFSKPYRPSGRLEKP